MSSRVPASLRAGIAALAFLLAAGGGTYYYEDKQSADLSRHPYVQSIAADMEISNAIKIAMVMAAYYESSYRHIGTPYIDKLGRGQPLTVCNGITGPEVIAGKWYSPQECYAMERTRYIRYEKVLSSQLPDWDTYTDMTKAVTMDFLHNKGEGAFNKSTMKKEFLAGNWVRACKQNERWDKGTVNGVLTVLPGLKRRGDANTDVCFWEDFQK